MGLKRRKAMRLNFFESPEEESDHKYWGSFSKRTTGAGKKRNKLALDNFREPWEEGPD